MEALRTARHPIGDAGKGLPKAKEKITVVEVPFYVYTFGFRECISKLALGLMALCSSQPDHPNVFFIYGEFTEEQVNAALGYHCVSCRVIER
ncbi:MAG: hypothetical protein WC457_01040 [Patescibacteria group bacterium]